MSYNKLMKNTVYVRFDSDVWRFFIPTACVAALCFIIGWLVPAIILTLVSLFMLYFFRDPYRACACAENMMYSPADGLVVGVEEVDEPVYMNSRAKKISIFLTYVRRKMVIKRMHGG